MSHLVDGVLRRLVDDTAGVADADHDHLAGCSPCRARLDTIEADAERIGAALAVDHEVDVDAALRRLLATPVAPVRPIATAPRRRVRTALRRPVVAGVAAAALVAGAGVAAANDWLPIFSAERIEPVRLGADDLVALPDLRDYGDVVVTDEPDVHPVPDAATAEEETGLDVPEVAALPRGVEGEPRYQVGEEAAVTFTYSADEAGSGAELDGSRARLVVGPGVALLWEGRAGRPDLIVGRARAPRAESAGGVPFEELRDHLLSLPGLPDAVASSLRTFGSGGSTLPFPVPEGRVTVETTEVDGVPATVLSTRDRSLAAVAWVDDGVVTVVAGPLDADEVLTVARDLR